MCRSQTSTPTSSTASSPVPEGPVVADAGPLKEAMIEGGYFLSPRFCERACLEAGELWADER